MPVAADASTDDGIAAVMDQVRRTDGDLYGLVNVAGGAAPSTWMPSTRVTRDDWRALFTAEPGDGVLHEPGGGGRDSRAQRKPGSIVSISSISGMNTAPFHIAYGTAKAAVVAMTRTMAVELALDNIRVNAVAPGVTETAGVAHLRRRRPRPRPPAPSRWDGAAGPRSRPAPSCSCCRTCRATSPDRRCSSTAASTSSGPISAPTTPRCSSRTNPSAAAIKRF